MELPRPTAHRLNRPPPYDHTISLDIQAIDSPLVEKLDLFVHGLLDFSLEKGLVLITGAITPEISPATVEFLFAYYQSRVTVISNGRSSATFAPLSRTGSTPSPFPLHADLYPESLLLMIYNNVPDDHSGATLLLPAEAFSRIIRSLGNIPPMIIAEMERLHRSPSDRDGFSKFYDILYGVDSPWRETLIRRLREECFTIKFPCGCGVILNDRQWLHGRAKPTGGVPADRLFRLAFDSSETLPTN